MKLLSIILLILLVSCYGKEPEKTGKEGKSLPTFSLLLMDSANIFTTTEIPKGKSFLLFLFGPQCPYSRAQMQSFIENKDLLNRFHIYVFTAAPFSQVKQFYDKYDLGKYSNITTGIDTKNIYGQYMQITGVPYVAIYDRNKRLKNSFLGEVSPKLLLDILEE
jgi:thiol-disulfide isomerase/thioredoxin